MTLQSEIIADAPGVYWTCLAADISGTTMTDLSGNGRNGTINGTPATTESFFGAACINFDGVDDYITRANDAALNPGTGQWCMEWWMKTNYGDGNYMNVAHRNDAHDGQGPLFYTRISNGVQHAWVGLPSFNPVGSVGLTDGVLRHIVFQREASGAVRTYINTVLDSTANITSNAAMQASSALQLAQTTSYQRYTGLLVHFAFYPTSSLSSDRRSAHYLAGLGPSTARNFHQYAEAIVVQKPTERNYHQYAEAVLLTKPHARLFHQNAEVISRTIPPIRNYHQYAEIIVCSDPGHIVMGLHES